MSNDTLDQLVAVSNRLGDPTLDYIILGEGNTAARADAESFWVKASGYELRTITAEGFVRVATAQAMALLARTDLSDQAVKDGLAAAKIDRTTTARPSVETLLHALCLSLAGVQFVAHTHPTAVNALTCSVGFETAFAGRLFPDEIVLCGPAPLLIPYTDPGVPLARTRAGIDQRLRRSLWRAAAGDLDAKSRPDRTGTQRFTRGKHHGHDGQDRARFAGHVCPRRAALSLPGTRRPHSHAPRRNLPPPTTRLSLATMTRIQKNGPFSLTLFSFHDKLKLIEINSKEYETSDGRRIYRSLPRRTATRDRQAN